MELKLPIGYRAENLECQEYIWIKARNFYRDVNLQLEVQKISSTEFEAILYLDYYVSGLKECNWDYSGMGYIPLKK